MNEVTVTLRLDEVSYILAVLGELPSKSGAWPLILKVKQQVDAQTADDAASE